MLEEPHDNDTTDVASLNEKERLLLRAFRQLSPQDRQHLLRLVVALMSTPG